MKDIKITMFLNSESDARVTHARDTPCSASAEAEEKFAEGRVCRDCTATGANTTVKRTRAGDAPRWPFRPTTAKKEEEENCEAPAYRG